MGRFGRNADRGHSLQMGLTWWLPTNKRGRSLGMPSKPWTTVPSGRVEKKTGLVAFSKNLHPLCKASRTGGTVAWCKPRAESGKMREQRLSLHVADFSRR